MKSTINLEHENNELLRVLSDGKYHSVKTLNTSLKNKQLCIIDVFQKYQQYGVGIVAHPINGFKLTTAFSCYGIKNIINSFGDCNTYFRLMIFDVLESTNDYLLRNNDLYLNHKKFPVVITELQTLGRGRHKKTWFSTLGGSITFSIYWRFTQSIKNLTCLPLLIGLIIVKVLNRLTDFRFQLKWPNDIIFNHKKVGGILIECRNQLDGSIATIIGIGINCKSIDQSRKYIPCPITDLFEITGKLFDRNYIVALILKELRITLAQFETKGFGFFHKEWEILHAYNDKPVKLITPNNQYVYGTVKGVFEDGALKLLTDSGIQRFSVGEISLRPARSYV